jgi:trimeric autotransporter adhesin
MIKYILILFTIVSSVFAQTPKGSWDTRFCPCGLKGWEPTSLTKDGDNIYINGHIDSSSFSDFGYIQGRRMVGLPLVWDGKEFSVLGGGVSPYYYTDGGKGYTVSNTIVVGDSVIVVGFFDSVGADIPAKSVGIWNKKKEVWEIPPQPNFIMGEIKASTADENDLFITGYFYDSTLKLINAVVRYNFKEQKWYELGLFFPNSYPSQVSISLNTKNLFVGGSFVKVEDDSSWYVSGIARWDRLSRSWYTIDSSLGGECSLLAGDGDTLYSAFRISDNGYVNLWSGSEWTAMSKDIVRYESPVKLVRDSGNVYLFSSRVIKTPNNVRDTLRYVARWINGEWEEVFEQLQRRNVTDMLKWGQFLGQLSKNEIFDGVLYNAGTVLRYNGNYAVPIDSGSCLGIAGPVSSMVNHNDTIYISGGFSFAGGVPAPGAAFWDGAGWNALGDIFNDSTDAGRNFTIYKDKLYAVRNMLSVWTGDHWRELGIGDTNAFEGANIRDMVVYHDTLVVGGALTGQNAPYGKMAKWDGRHWSRFDGDVTSGDENIANDGIYTMAAKGDDLYIGGSFTMHAGDSMNSIAHWDGEQWLPIITNGQKGLGSRSGLTQGFISELAFLDSRIIAMGNNFDSVMKSRCGGMVAINDDAFQSFLVERPFTFSSKPPMTTYKDDIFVGRYAGTSPALIRDGLPISLGKIEDNTISSLVTDSKGNLYVGGSFVKADGVLSQYFGIWNPNTAAVENDQGPSLDLENDFAIYPNPAVETVTILLSEDSSPSQISIKDQLGRELLSLDTTETVIRHDIRLFPNGVYYVTVVTGGVNQTKKFIVSH